MEDSIASPDNTIASTSTHSDTEAEIVSNTYRTKDHWVPSTKNEGQKVWRCFHCKEKTFSINTSRLHLKTHTLSCSYSPLSEGEIFQQITKVEMDKSIIDLVVRTGISFSILDNPLFHKMARNLRYVINSYKVPHSTTISRHLIGDHSTVHKCYYNVVTGSWISDDWKIVNVVLSFKKSGQIAVDILSVIEGTLEEYFIKNKIFALTMDNTTTNKAVSRLLQNKLPNKELISIGCMCHILNLIVQEGLKEISSLREKIHKVMKYLANPLASGRLGVLESYCQISGLKFLQPILEIDTRWNSTLAMFKRYIHLHPAIHKMCLKKSLMPDCLDNEDLITLKSFCQLLKLFESATLVLSKEHSNSISDAIMVILEISQHTNKANMIKIKKKFNKYWNIIIDHVIIAHVLDPRYKLEHLKATLIEVGRYRENEAEQILPAETTKTTETAEIVEINDDYPISNNFLFPRRRISKKRKYEHTNTTEAELELYEKEPLEEFISDKRKENNGILFWESLSKKFLVLSKMARDYLSVKPSSVSSERSFSRAGFTITNDRATIGEKTVSSTILMHSWLVESQNEFSPLKNLP
ncbi:6882_t:CDS:2 [Dentiscutata heterogama]|uniref:6882_t:CDS:1 n=1 Tax=Dentiscutata heterogama TaxID=1316150 RepID=A0ACA9N5Q9_9GLOM|nr:6882_t:CDS:2 [Dentiscutata heterogama]